MYEQSVLLFGIDELTDFNGRVDEKRLNGSHSPYSGRTLRQPFGNH